MAGINLNLSFTQANALLACSNNKALTTAILDGEFDKFAKRIASLVGYCIIDLDDQNNIISVALSYDSRCDGLTIEQDYNIRWFNEDQMKNFVSYIYDQNKLKHDNTKESLGWIGQFVPVWDDDIIEHVCNSSSSSLFKRTGYSFALVIPKKAKSYISEFMEKVNTGKLTLIATNEGVNYDRAISLINDITRDGLELFQSMANSMFPKVEAKMISGVFGKTFDNHEAKEFKVPLIPKRLLDDPSQPVKGADYDIDKNTTKHVVSPDDEVNQLAQGMDAFDKIIADVPNENTDPIV